MVVIHFSWTTCQKTPLLWSLNGDGTVTVVPLKAFRQLVMPTIAGLMISQWTSLARPRSWMIPCFGITTLRTPFGTHWNTLACAPRTALYSTRRSSNSPWMKLTSQDSTSPQPAYAHLNVSWMPPSEQRFFKVFTPPTRVWQAWKPGPGTVSIGLASQQR